MQTWYITYRSEIFSEDGGLSDGMPRAASAIFTLFFKAIVQFRIGVPLYFTAYVCMCKDS